MFPCLWLTIWHLWKSFSVSEYKRYLRLYCSFYFFLHNCQIISCNVLFLFTVTLSKCEFILHCDFISHSHNLFLFCFLIIDFYHSLIVYFAMCNVTNCHNVVKTCKIVTLSSLQGIFIFFTSQCISHNVILFLIIATSLFCIVTSSHSGILFLIIVTLILTVILL